MAKLDLHGVRFGSLVANSAIDKESKGTYWMCICDCGNIHNVFIGHLRAGRITSCGCVAKGSLGGKSRTPTHVSYHAMRGRCLFKGTNGYENYGGKGIKICSRWDDYLTFLGDMGERPKGHTLDRINPAGDYTPDNCRWADSRTQARNRIKSIVWVVKGIEYETAGEAGKANSVSGTCVARWCDGWVSKITGREFPPKDNCRRIRINAEKN